LAGLSSFADGHKSFFLFHLVAYSIAMKKRKLDAAGAVTNGDAPATQHDLSLWGGQLATRMDRFEDRMDHLEERMDRFEDRMDHLEERMDRLEERIGRVERVIESILSVVQSIDGQLKEWRTIPQQVQRRV
jgi:chromosome segregation ATPase